MIIIARVYSHSEYLPKDYIATEAWLRKAAELGSDEVKKQLAKLLSVGNGIAQDYEEAFNIYHELILDCDLDAITEEGFV
jgi:TPR repeat protein